MSSNFNSKAENIYVSIGASIGSCCYEVGSEILYEAKALGYAYAVEQKENSYYLSISEILESQLLESGIQKENLEVSKECTCCKSDTYFSYRAKNITGRFAGVIYLN